MTFEKYFDKEHFLFIILDKQGSLEFVEKKICQLNIKNWQVVGLGHPTNGQAETVYRGLSQLKSLQEEPIVIFNIDSVIKNYLHHDRLFELSGTLDVVSLSGDHWSFVAPYHGPSEKRVKFTTEKRRVSDLCSTGLYTFKNFELYADAFEYTQTEGVYENEIYIT